MTFESGYEEAYVWVWLTGAPEPVVAGRLSRDGPRLIFNYGRSYLDRENAIPIYLPELPLRTGAIAPLPNLTLPSCIRDAAPDAWGRRVILNRKFGKAREVDLERLDDLAYLLESGSDRIGALDFQRSSTEYVPRGHDAASLEQLLHVSEMIDAGVPIPQELHQALFQGSSLGGARPKATIQEGERKYIAKFSSATDTHDVVKSEFIAMRMAALIGLDVAPVRLERVTGKDVLLIERFDRAPDKSGWSRRAMVSALTLFELDEMMARYASYQDLAEIIRHRFVAPTASLRELYGRLVFNVLCGNTDDHARNHAAFWDGQTLTLTPAYDICPQNRAGNEATQAMLIKEGNRFSKLSVCLKAAVDFLLDEDEALTLMQHQIGVVRDNLGALCDETALSEMDRNLVMRRQFLNPFIFEDAPQALKKLCASDG